MSFFTHLLLISIFCISSSWADEIQKPEEITLPPIVTEGTPADALKYDPVVPAIEKKTTLKGSNGGITEDLRNSLPFHFGDNSRAGNVTNVSGYTKTAEEVDVNLLGIPLNNPQGGGFNLTSFPQFLWQGYSYQIGPSLGAYDPRGTFGSLNLRLWTAETLKSKESSSRVTALASTAHVQQFSAGVDYKDQASLLAGYSTGKVKGPAGSVSSRILEGDTIRSKFHLLASDQKVSDFLSERASTATATYHMIRIIPVLQLDAQLPQGSLLKTSFFYDNSFIKTDDPEVSSYNVLRKRSRSSQGGFESAWISGRTKVGFGIRQFDYHQSVESWNSTATTAQFAEYSAKTEQIGNAQLTHSFGEKENLLVEPTLGGTAVTRFGFRPLVTVGFKKSLENADSKSTDAFLRTGYHNRFPSMIDRYPTYAGFSIPNPDLQEEKVLSAETGLERKTATYDTALTLIARKTFDTRFFRPYVSPSLPAQIINNGKGHMVSVIHTLNVQPLSILSLSSNVNFSRARFEDAHAPMFYMPDLIAILTADLHDPNNRFGLSITQRGSSEYYVTTESSATVDRLPGYGYMDAAIRANIMNDWGVSVGVENLFDKPILYRADQPTSGRLYTVSASGTF